MSIEGGAKNNLYKLEFLESELDRCRQRLRARQHSVEARFDDLRGIWNDEHFSAYSRSFRDYMATMTSLRRELDKAIEGIEEKKIPLRRYVQR